MNKALIQKNVLIIILILGSSLLFFFIGYATGEHNGKRSDEENIVLGHSLFQLYMATTNINEVKDLVDEEQKLLVISENLKQMSFASTIIDTLTGAEVLRPIATELTVIYETIDSNAHRSEAISEIDEKRYERLFDEIQILHNEYSAVYYEPNSEATPKENISDFGELIQQKDRLQNKDY